MEHLKKNLRERIDFNVIVDNNNIEMRRAVRSVFLKRFKIGNNEQRYLKCT